MLRCYTPVQMSFARIALCFTFCAVVYAQQAPRLRLGEAQDVSPTSYRVDLQLEPAQTQFSGTVTIALELGAPTRTIWLNASEIHVDEATAQQAGKTSLASAASSGDFTSFTMPSELQKGPASLTIRYTGRIRPTQPAGIFSSEDQGNRYLYTQFEATDARDAFPCFDEPSYKTPWQLTLHVPAADIAVSNTPVVSEQTSGATKTVVFAETDPLPSYLIAFAVGPFEAIPAGTAGRNHIPVRIITPKGRSGEAKFAAEVTAKFIDRLEAYFGIPYPYPKCDQLALLKADFGAMENAGLVTYSPEVLLAKPSEDNVRRQREYVLVAFHELAHQWFGDLVTLRWWDDVWLNEAFASWMEQKMRAEWNPKWDHAQDIVELQQVEESDTLKSARKIRQEITTPGDIDNAFDSITYEKGAAVIGMFEHWMGPDVFQSGVHNYLLKNAHKTATTNDLLRELDAASHRNITAAFSTFIDQPGIPILNLQLKCSAGKTSLFVEQHRLVSLASKNATDHLWQIPVCVRYGGASGAPHQACELITKRKRDWPIESAACPEWVDGNAAAQGYYRVAYEPGMLANVVQQASANLAASERTELIGNVRAAAKAGRTPLGESLKLVKHFAEDPDPSVLQSDLNLALLPFGFNVSRGAASGNILPPQDAPAYRSFLHEAFAKRATELGWLTQPGDSYERKTMRTDLLPWFTIFADDENLRKSAHQLAEQWLAGKRDPAVQDIGLILATDAAFGDEEEAARMRTAASTTVDIQDRQHLLHALRYFRTPAAVNANLSAYLRHQTPDEDGASLFTAISTPQTQTLAFDFVQAHFDEIARMLPFFIKPALPMVGSAFCDPASREKLAAFFAPRTGQLPGSERVLAQTLESIDSCIALKSEQSQSIHAFVLSH